MTQAERIIEYIRDWGSITTRDAFLDLGIARLASRIYDLEKMGYEFNRKTKTTKNRYGEATHYTEYSLKEEQK